MNGQNMFDIDINFQVYTSFISWFAFLTTLPHI